MLPTAHDDNVLEYIMTLSKSSHFNYKHTTSVDHCHAYENMAGPYQLHSRLHNAQVWLKHSPIGKILHI
jgi:hypothetical protein